MMITAMTGLPIISNIISHRRNAVFGHIVRLQDQTQGTGTLMPRRADAWATTEP